MKNEINQTDTVKPFPSRMLLFTGGAYIYGAEEVSLRVIRYLSFRHDVFCAVNGWNDGQFIERLIQMNVPYKAIKLGWVYISKPLWTLDTLWHAPKAYWQYARLIQNFKPTVQYHSSFRSLFLLYPFLNKKNVLHVHDRFADARTISFIHKVDKKVSRYIAISDFVKQNLIEIGINESKIDLIYNGIDFRNSSIAEFPSDNGKIIHIGVVGQLVPRKGHLLLLQALAQLSDSSKTFCLHIFGQGDVSYRSLLEAEIKRRGMETSVIWHGYVQDKDQIYREVDFCVVPAMEPEPFGLTAIEPAMYGRPVLASDTGALPEIIQDEITGLLFRTGDIDSLVKGLHKMMQDPLRMKEMGENALKIYHQRFSESEMNRKIESLLLQLESAK